jgi:hypothetical protein
MCTRCCLLLGCALRKKADTHPSQHGLLCNGRPSGLSKSRTAWQTLRQLTQGNGHERDKLHFEDQDLYILDIYGRVRHPYAGVIATVQAGVLLCTSTTHDTMFPFIRTSCRCRIYGLVTQWPSRLLTLMLASPAVRHVGHMLTSCPPCSAITEVCTLLRSA